MKNNVIFSRCSFTRNTGVRIAGMSIQEAQKSSESRRCPTNSVIMVISHTSPSRFHNVTILISTIYAQHTERPPQARKKMKFNQKKGKKKTKQASFIWPRWKCFLGCEKVCATQIISNSNEIDDESCRKWNEAKLSPSKTPSRHYFGFSDISQHHFEKKRNGCNVIIFASDI